MFLILFVTTGIGNGSTYRMIPSSSARRSSRRRGLGEAAAALALKAAGIESARRARLHRRDRRLRRLPDPARVRRVDRRHRRPARRWRLLVFYATCLALTWWYYLRRSPAAGGARLAERGVLERSLVYPRPMLGRGKSKRERTKHDIPESDGLVQQSFAKVAPISEQAAMLF